MSAFPSVTIGVGSSMEPESGVADDFTDDGTHHSRELHDRQYWRWRLVHPGVTWADFVTLRDDYLADKRGVRTLSYGTESPAQTYSVRFTACPRITINHGDNTYTAESRVRGFKD